MIGEVFADVVVVLGQPFELKQQQQVPGGAVLWEAAEVSRHEMRHSQLVVTVPFLQVAEKAPEAARLHLLQLRPHGLQIRCQGERGPVFEVDAVGGIDSAQIQVVLHALSESRERLGVEAGHQE